MPSIIMGLFGFALILVLRRTVAPQANTGLLLSAACLALLVLPVLVTATREAVRAVPPNATTAYSASSMNEHSVWMISSPTWSIFSWRRRMDCSVMAGLPTGKPVSSWMRPVTWMW